MRKHRNDGRRGRDAVSVIAAAGMAAAIGLRLWTKAVQKPVDSLAIAGAVAATLVIVVNAVFLQSRPHDAPFVVNPLPQVQAIETRPGAGALTAPPSAATHASGRRNDPIADLIAASVGSPARVLAVQRVLAEFGYGQIRPSGIVDRPTSLAIERFESEHKMPVTGRLSYGLLNAIAVMTGRPID